MKRFAAILVSSVLILAISGCSGQSKTTVSASSENDKGITINVGDITGYELVKDANALGYFTKEFGKDGVKVSVKNFQSGPPELEALTAKDLDIALMGDQPAVQGVANGIGIQVISGLLDGTHGNGLIARTDAGINKVADLKGKKVGVPVGTTSHQLLLIMLAKNNLKVSDIQLVNLSAGDMVTALQSGEIQAAVTFDPSLSQAVKAGGIKKISDAEGYKKTVSVIVARTRFTKEHPQLAVRFLKVMKETAAWRSQHFEQSLDIIAKQTGISADTLRPGLEATPPMLNLDNDSQQSLLATAQYLKNSNIIKQDVTIKQIFNDQYAKAAGIQ